MPTRYGGDGTGILLYSAGVFFFAVNDALAKWLIVDYSAGQLMAMRSVSAGLVLTVAALLSRTDLRVQDQYSLNTARVLSSAADTFCFYFATRALPLADVMTLYMVAPLIIVTLSGVVLGERVSLARWFAVACGFGGVLIALNPGRNALSPSALIALAGAVLFAVTITITRRLRTTGLLKLTVYQVFGTGAIGSMTALFGWTPPSAADLGLMFAIGVVSMLCFVGITKALSLAPASLLAPLQYTSIVWAALLGWIVWGDVPGAGTVIGAGVIIVSGLFALRSEPPATPA